MRNPFKSIQLSDADDRGNPCSLLPPIADFPLRLPWQGWTTDPSPVRRARLIAWAAAALAALTFWYAISRPLSPGSDWTSAGGLVIAIGVWGAGIFWYTAADAKIGRKFRAHRYAQAGFCPSCDYDLIGLPSADDGCTECPECGSAWHCKADEPTC